MSYLEFFQDCTNGNFCNGYTITIKGLEKRCADFGHFFRTLMFCLLRLKSNTTSGPKLKLFTIITEFIVMYLTHIYIENLRPVNKCVQLHVLLRFSDVSFGTGFCV